MITVTKMKNKKFKKLWWEYFKNMGGNIFCVGIFRGGFNRGSLIGGNFPGGSFPDTLQ